MCKKQRKFIRTDLTKLKQSRQFYQDFRKWLQLTYPPNGVPSHDDWEEVRKEDEAVVYHSPTDTSLEETQDEGSGTCIGSLTVEDVEADIDSSLQFSSGLDVEYELPYSVDTR